MIFSRNCNCCVCPCSPHGIKLTPSRAKAMAQWIVTWNWNSHIDETRENRKAKIRRNRYVSLAHWQTMCCSATNWNNDEVLVVRQACAKHTPNTVCLKNYPVHGDVISSESKYKSRTDDSERSSRLRSRRNTHKNLNAKLCANRQSTLAARAFCATVCATVSSDRPTYDAVNWAAATFMPLP